MRATLMAGVPAENSALFHRIRFVVGDPAAWMAIGDGPTQQTLLIIRDIEVERARGQVAVDRVAAPGEFAPPGGLSSDRATATAEAVAEALRQHEIQYVSVDRTLPFIFAWYLQQAGIQLVYDSDLGVIDRRTKDAQELRLLAAAQRVTEQCIEMACGRIAHAEAAADGTLVAGGETLTSQRVKAMINHFLVDRGFSNSHGSIVATAPESGDCHASGSGPLRTGVPVIIDIFPRDDMSRYWGDCTRTVVHGAPTDTVRRMHAAVIDAKRAAIGACRVGTRGDAVHRTTVTVLEEHGFEFARGRISDVPVMPHGTGHGVGLEVHEPILLDEGGPEILPGEVLTVEPGLYSRIEGGVRVEDMIAVTSEGVQNFNQLHEGLDWRT